MANGSTAETLNVLTEVEAQERAGRVSDVGYTLELSLAKGSPTYEGALTVRFSLAEPEAGTFLDCTSKSIDSLVVNGSSAEVKHERNRLYLDGGDLSAENVVEISYTNEYDHIGAGLHQFVDPEDGEEYLYTHFEPYDAHRLLSCFDQPDIKASLDLTVTAPSEWEVAANYPVVSSSDAGDGRTTHVFTETPRISTYLYAFIAGAVPAVRRHVVGRGGGDVPGRALPRVDRAVLRSGRVFPGHAGRVDVFLGVLRLPLSIRTSTTRCLCPSSIWARWRTWAASRSRSG